MRTDGFGRERINTSWRKGTAGSKYAELITKDAAEASTGARKNDWIPGLPDRGIWRQIVHLPEFQIELSGGMHQR